MATRTKTDSAWSGLDSTEDIVAAVRRGEMVVILDDEDRENEGDLIMAATKVRPEDVNFMARYGRGLICLTLTRQRCDQLRLPLMVSNTDLRKTTNFTISIEAAEGVTTGISAHDRARTILAAVAPEARPDDLRQPGHIFPLMAQPRSAHARGPHGGGLRSCAACGARARRRDRRDPERRRRDGTARRPHAIRAAPQVEDRHDRGLDRVSPADRRVGRDHR